MDEEKRKTEGTRSKRGEGADENRSSSPIDKTGVSQENAVFWRFSSRPGGRRIAQYVL